MEDSNSIPVMKQPRNMMEVGPNGNNLEVMARRRHPIDDMQRYAASGQRRLGTSFLGTDEEEEVRRLYGSGFAMKLATERRMAEELGSAGVAGMPSSNMMMDVLSGNDMKIEFEDILNLPEHRPLFVKHQEDPHTMMEHKLGMMM